MNFLESLFQKKVILLTGKGGIGKSLTAASLSQYAVEHGKKVCLVESNSQEQLAPLFRQSKIGHNLTEVLPNLHVINLNPQDNFRDFVVLHLGFAKLFEKVFTKTLVKSFINMLPGIAELTLLGRLFYFSEIDEKHDFDHIILDGFASGHFLSLLKTPDAVLNSGMVGPVIKETERVKDFIFNQDKVAVAIVTMPEPLIVSEAVDFAKKFKNELNISHTHVLVNRCLPLSSGEQEALEALQTEEQAVQYLQSRLGRQKESLNQLKRGLAELEDSGKQPELILLPDLGAIQEPLVNNFASNWFANASKDSM